MAANVQESLSKLFDTSGDKFRINSVSTFSYKERDAHKWDENIVKQYFTAKLDLPGYGDDILKNRINGSELISIDESFPHPVLKFQNPLHTLKVLSHVKDTRQRVLEHGKKTRPESLMEWEVSHVASWLHIEQGNAHASLIALRNQWTGITLLDINTHHGGARGWTNIPSEHQSTLLTAVQNLITTHQPKPTDTTIHNKKKNKKHLTAIKKRTKASLASSEDESEHVTGDPNLVPSTSKTPETNSSPAKEVINVSKIVQASIIASTIADQAANDNPSYHFDRPISATKKKLKNKLKKSSLDDNIPQLPQTDPNLELELRQSEKEREKFHEKLEFLHSIVEEHSSTINKLRTKSEQLQREKELTLLDFATLTSNSQLQNRLITTLTKDRDLAVKEVEKITRLFHQHAEIQKAEFSQEIEKLSVEVVQSRQKVATLKYAKTRENNPEMSGELRDFSVPKQARENANVDLDFLLSSSSSPVKGMRGVVEENDGDSDLEGALDIAIMAANTANQQQSQSSQQQHRFPVRAQNTSSILKQSSTQPTATLSQSQSVAAGGGTAAAAGGGASVLELMQKSTLQTQQNWSSLFNTFILPKPSTACSASVLAFAGDTRQLLLQIACKWIRLGRWLLASAHSSTSHSHSNKTLATLAPASRGLLLKMINFNPNTSASLPFNPDSTAANSFADTAEEIEKSKDIIFDVNAEAVAIVFAMAAVHRRLTQNTASNGKGTADLLFTHSNNTSDLQITNNLKEISRENLREFLSQHLSIVVPWDRFDALLQRIDLNRKGFVQLPDFLHAFLGVHPLAPSKGVNKEVHGGGSSATLSSVSSPQQSVHLSLPRQCWSMAVSLLLTIATDEIIACSRPLSEFWLTILTRPTTCKSSAVRFARYITHVQEQVANQRRSKAELILLDEALENAGQKSRVSIQQEAESKLVHDQALITGLLQELTFKPVNNHLKSLIDQLAEAKSLVKYSDKDKRPEVLDNRLLQQVLRFICYRHEELCQFVAHGLGIYDLTVEDDILTAFSALFTPFLHMRSACQPPLQLPTATADTILSSSSKKLTFEQYLEQWLNENPTVHIPITPPATATQTSSLAANVISSRVEVDYQVSELLGFPLLHILQQHPTPLHSLQMTVEQMMVDLKMIEFDLHLRHGSNNLTTTYYSNKLATSPSSPSKKLEQRRIQTEAVRSEALMDIQRTLHRELWDQSKQFQPHTQQHEEEKVKPQLLPHVVSEVNTVLAQQRIEHVTAFLESLNVKAQKKKHILQTLLSLWQSAKVVTSSVAENAATVSKQKQREVSMPISEIFTQTKSIQAVLLKDMQASPNTRIAQLEAKTELLKKGIQTGVITGEDEEGEDTLKKALLEVDSMKASLLQANNDAMRLAARIMQQLQGHV